MSRRRLPRAEQDLYSRHSVRIIRALKAGDLDHLDYLLLKFLVDEIEVPGSNLEAIYTLRNLAAVLDWPKSEEWLRHKAVELERQGWITAERRRGPQAPWIFRLTGAAIDGERDESPTNFQVGNPPDLETNSKREHSPPPAKPLLDGVSKASEFPTDESPRAEQSREEKKPLSYGKQDHALGKTTTAEVEPADATDRMLDALARLDGDSPRVSVEKAPDGSLVWCGKPAEGERGFLEDCQAMVDAGFARWESE